MVVELARPSVVFDTQDKEKCDKISEMIFSFLDMRMEEFMRKGKHNPVSFTYMNDGTPMRHVDRWVAWLGDRKIARTGGKCSEYLIERVWAQDCNDSHAVMFAKPRRMTDKSGEAHAQATRQLCKFPFEMGASSINTTHVVFDRALWSTEDRLFRQHHNLALNQYVEGWPLAKAALLRMLSWFTSAGCCDHDAHKSIERALEMELANDQGILKRAHKHVRSMRQGFQWLYKYSGDWLAARIGYEDWDMPSARKFWTTLGLRPFIVDEMVELQMRWNENDQRLYVAEKFRADDGVAGRVASVLLAVWRFRPFKGGRWGRLEEASKTVVACEAIGMDDLVTFIKGKPDVSEWYMGRYGLHDHGLHRFFRKVAGSAHVSGNVLRAVMEDDRLPKLLPQLLDGMDDDIEEVISRPPKVWELMAQKWYDNPEELRQECIDLAVAQASFMAWRYRSAGEAPWDMVNKDWSVYLDELRLQPRPTEYTKGCIWDMEQIGWPREVTYDGFRRLEALGHSTKSAEEGHAAAQGCIRQHPQLGEDALCTRAHVTQARPLFSHSIHERKMVRAEKALQKARRKNPNKIGAKQVYVKELLDCAAQKKKDKGKKYVNCNKRVIKTHGKYFTALSAERLRRYRTASVKLRDERQKETFDKIVKLELQRQEALEAWEKEKAANKSAGRMSLCRLTHLERQEFDDMWTSPLFSQKEVQMKKAERPTVVEKPDPVETNLLKSQPIYPGVKHTFKPWWVRKVVYNRMDTRHTIMRFTGNDGTYTYGYFGSALQNPMVAHFLRLELQAGAPDPLPISMWGEEWRNYFKVVRGAFLHSDDAGVFGEFRHAHVLENCCFRGPPARIVSDADWETMADFLARFSGGGDHMDEDGEDEETEELECQMDQALLGMHPTLRDHIKAKKKGLWTGDDKRKKGSNKMDVDSSDSAGSSSTSGDEAVSDTDSELEALERLAEMRAAMRPEGAEEEAPFAWRVMGGKWTKRVLGVEFDAFRGEARTLEAKQWSVLYGLGRSGSFTLRKYGSDLAKVMAQYWVEKRTYFFTIWQENGSVAGRRYTAEELRGFVERGGFVAAVRESRGRQLIRLLARRGQRPR